MLRIKGSPLQLCDGWTRRDLLHAGKLMLGGLGLADLFRLQEASAARPVAARMEAATRANAIIRHGLTCDVFIVLCSDLVVLHPASPPFWVG